MSSQSDLFLADILSEPETLERVLVAYSGSASPFDALGEITERRVVFVGMGSSRFAALSAAARLRAGGIDAWAEYASAEPVPQPSETLVVAISASGTTPETVEAARQYRGVNRVVAITNEPESALAQSSDTVLPLLAGEEAGGIACRTYQATVALLQLLVGRVLRTREVRALRSAVPAVRELIESRVDWLGPALAILDGAPIDVIAPAERQSSAEQSALMLREAPRVRAAACETGDWLHVDVYLTRPPGYRAILFPGSPFDAHVVEWIERRGGAIVAIGACAPGASEHIDYPGADDPLVATLVETTAVELLAVALWQRSLT
jgi:fructoselysine-6-P-deglycase FrlB-like protein